jgi:hypothetical protein
MGRLMSVAFTEQAVRDRSKTVTRRKGWWKDKHGRRLVKPGDRITLCRKVMGRKRGEPLERIAEVQVVSVTRHRLSSLLTSPSGALEMEREGFPGMWPAQFIQQYFVDAQDMSADAEVTRIEWRYLDEGVE